MPTISAVFAFVFYCAILVLMFSSSVFSKTIKCERVSQNLKNVLSLGRKQSLFSSTYLVESSRPFFDPQMRICYDGRFGRQESCCSYQMENEYVRHGQRRMKKMVSFQDLEKELKIRKDTFIKDELKFREGLSRYLSDHISYRLRLSEALLRQPIITFLGQLLSNHTRPSAVEILDNFIVSVSPFIYYQTIKKGDLRGFVKQKQDCLANSYRQGRGTIVLQPKESLVTQLRLAKTARQRLQNSVGLMLRVLQQLETLKYPKWCLESVARSQLCPVCFGGARRGSVCAKACQNIFHGCHMHWADLEPSWDRFVSSAKELSERIVARLDLSASLRHIIDSVVQTLVQSVLPKLKELDPKLRSDCFVNGHKISPVGYGQYDGRFSASFPAYVTDHLRSFSTFLGQQINFFTNILQRTCADLPETECWNGTFFSSRGYTKPVPEFYLSQQKNNPEVSGRTAKQKEVVDRLKQELDNNYHEFDSHHDIVESTRYLGPPSHITRPLRPRGGRRRFEGSGEEKGGSDTVPDGSGDRKQPGDDEDLESSGASYLPVPKSITAEPPITLRTKPHRIAKLKRPRGYPRFLPTPSTSRVTLPKEPPRYTVRIVSPTPKRSKNSAAFSNPSFTLYVSALLSTRCLLVLR